MNREPIHARRVLGVRTATEAYYGGNSSGEGS